MIRNASLIARTKENYFLQVRNVVHSESPDGQFPFTFPGALALFGGGLEHGETPETGFKRELTEELPGIELSNLEHRLYDWSKQTDPVLERADKVFHGNVQAFLGFDLKAPIPLCALGKQRHELYGISYKDWIARTTSDNFYIGSVEREVAVKEGAAGVWVPYIVLKTTVMVPTDKLAILDDLSRRIERGEIQLS